MRGALYHAPNFCVEAMLLSCCVPEPYSAITYAVVVLCVREACIASSYPVPLPHLPDAR